MKAKGLWTMAMACGCLCAVSMYSPVCQAQSQNAGVTASEAGGTNALPVVSLKGNYFEKDGKPFLPVGVNWVPAKAAMEWPYQWDPASIEADFAQMHELGVNAVRLDLVWPWFEPRPDDYNPQAWKELDFLVSLANRYKIYLHPELLVGGEVGEAYWDVPYRQGRDPQSDPYMLRLETDFAGELARRFGKTSAILAWDLTDEPPFWIVANSTTDSMAINWTRLISGAIRRNDTMHPIVVGTATEDLEHGSFRADVLRKDVDFFSVHPYTIYEPKLFPDPMLSERQTYGAAFQTSLAEGAGRPVMIQEIGASSAQYSPEAIAQYERAALYSGLGAGANGFLIWCYTDAAPSQYSKVPYLRSPHETQFGIVTWNRKERPAARMFTDFSKTVGSLDLQGVAPATADAAILVPNEWSKPYGDESHFGLTGPEIAPYTSTDEGGAVAGQPLPNHSEENARLEGAWLSAYLLARRSGIKPAFPREYADWKKYPLLLLPSPLTSTDSMMIHLHSDFWERASAYVQDGGVLYASVSGDAAIPEMEPLFGARLVDHIPVHEVTLKVMAPFGNLKPGDTFTYLASPDAPPQWAATLEVNGGQVIAVDQDGRPALVAHELGRGKTLLCAYPIEMYLADQPSAFEGAQDTHRIYESLIEWAHVKRLVWTDNPAVEASALDAQDHGYVVLVNHSGTQQRATLGSSLPLTSLTQVTADGPKTVSRQNGGWQVDLQPYDGAVLAWK